MFERFGMEEGNREMKTGRCASSFIYTSDSVEMKKKDLGLSPTNILYNTSPDTFCPKYISGL
jgi:hypothetical protein